MGKKREERSRKLLPGDAEYDLDAGYSNPIRSVQDLSFDTITTALARSRYLQLLLAITAIGTFLRFYHLDYNALWLDEATTYYESQASFAGIWQTSVTGEFHPPLFNWITHIMLTVGHSEIVLRFMPAVCGVLAIPVIYLIGKEYRDRNVGIISAALLTFSYFGIFYSQEARAYSLVLLFFSLTILFYLWALRTTESLPWILFGVSAAVSVWSHYYTLIGLAVIFLHAVIILRDRLKEHLRNGKNLITGAGILFILALPLLLLVFERYSKLSASAPTYGVLGPILFQETVMRFSGGYSPDALILALIYLVLMAAGLYILLRENRDRLLLSLMLFFLPLIISIILSSKITMNPRYLIYLLPVYLVTIAMSYPLIFRLFPNRNLVYAAVLIIGIINIPFLAGYYSGYVKEDWRGLSGKVTETAHPGDLIVVAPGYIAQPFGYYYSNNSENTIQIGATTGAELDRVYQTKGNSTMYLVVTGDISAANPQGDAISWIDTHARVLSRYNGAYLLIAQ